MSKRNDYVIVRIIKAKDLVAADKNGFSDPYTIVTVGKSKKVTKVIKKTLNPEWNETFEFLVNPQLDQIRFKVMDKDRFSKDDFIGEIRISLVGLPRGQEIVQWQVLERVPNGEIQIGLKAITFDSTQKRQGPPAADFHKNVVNTPVGTPQASYYSPQMNHSPVPQQNAYYGSGAPQASYYSPQVNHSPVPQYAQPSNPNLYANTNTPPPNYATVKAQGNAQFNSAQAVPSYISGQSSYISPSVSPGSAPRSPAHASIQTSAEREGFGIQYSELVFEKKLAAGAFGEVWKGDWVGTPVAIKKILKADIGDDDLEEFSQEMILTSKLRHPNIVQFLGACFEPELCLIAEFMDRGCLFDVLHKETFTWRRKLDFALDIAKGLMYLHTRAPPIIHRDVKSLNILVTKDWKCTITDFGLTRIKDKAMLSTRVGSPAWSAPEILRGENYDEKADVFSYAVVLWEIITQEPPYKGMNPNQIIGSVAFKQPGMRLPLPHCPYPALLQLIENCWHDDPNVRLLFPDILRELKAISVNVTD